MTEHGLTNPNQTRVQQTALQRLLRELQSEDLAEHQAHVVIRALARIMLSERFGGCSTFLRHSRAACGHETVDRWFGNLKADALGLPEARTILSHYELPELASQLEVEEEQLVAAASLAIPRLVGLLTSGMSSTGTLFSLLQMM